MNGWYVPWLLLGCLSWSASSGAAEPKLMRAGAAQVDITPLTWPVRVSGGFAEGSATVAHDRLMSRALVLDNGETQLAIAVVDNLMMPRAMLDEVKAAVQQQIGIPADRMLISATHTHSAPSVMGALGSRPDPAYTQFLPGQIVKSIVLAHGHLVPARLGSTAVRDYAHNHCRRWIFRPDRLAQDPFGQASVRAMMHPGHESPQHIGPAGPADPDLSLLSVQQLDGQPIAVLANYALHYKGAAAVSSDFCGRFGEALAARIGATSVQPAFVAMMSQGTSGDSMWMDYARPPSDPGLDGYTQAVADRAKQAYDTIAYHNWVSIEMAETTLQLARRVPDASRLAWARQVVHDLAGRLPTTWAEVYAWEAIHLHEEPSVELKLQALRIGELGITAIPAEVFGITGLKIKAQSPLVPTFNIELANGAEGYIPPPEQHDLGGYTTWPARTAGLELTAEPQVIAAVVALLEQVSGAPRVYREPPADAYVRMVERDEPYAFWRCDELEGTTAHDATGQGRDGVYEPGMAFFLPGRTLGPLEFAEQTPGRAVHFAGGGMRADLGDLGTQYSIELWCWNGLPSDARPVVGHLLALAAPRAPRKIGEELSLMATPDGQVVLAYRDDSGTRCLGTTPLALRTWNQVVLVRDGRQVTIHLNGRTEAESTCDTAPPPSARSQLLLAKSPDGDQSLEGRLDDVAVYLRPLTPSQIAAHYAAALAASETP